MSSTNENIVIGRRLQQYRQEKSLSQKAMAERLVLSLRAYQNYERGERQVSVELIRALWSTFEVDPVWLLTGKRKMEGMDVGRESAAHPAAEEPPSPVYATGVTVGEVARAYEQAEPAVQGAVRRVLRLE